MSKKIITISREFGSGGRSVGKRVAELLDVPCYDKELVKRVATETGFDEKFIEQQGEYASPWKKIFSYAFSGLGSNQPLNRMSAEDFLWALQCKVILELAEKEPCVIVGRCADYILRDREDTLNVFIHAEPDFRIDRIVRLYGESEKEPQKRIDEKDKHRQTYYSHYTGRKWGAFKNYHIDLNTSVTGIERAAQFIVDVAKNPGEMPQ